jgi:hypothetical protein
MTQSIPPESTSPADFVVDKPEAAVSSIPQDKIADDLRVKLAEYTANLFGGTVVTSNSHDPQFPEDTYDVISVTTKLRPQEAAEAERIWVKAAHAIAPTSTHVRLAIRFAR